MKATTSQEREMLLGEIKDEALGTIQEWLRRWMREDQRADSPGEEIRLRYYEDGTTVVELDDEPIMQIRFRVELDVLDHVELVNEPIGGEIPSQWSKVPAGWFVKTPKGDWLEVGKTSLEHGTVQMVSLKVGGSFHAFPRKPSGPVKVRRGSLAPRDLSDAMASLEDAFITAILHDEPPMQS